MSDCKWAFVGFVQTQISRGHPGIILRLPVEPANLESKKLLKICGYLVYDSFGKSKIINPIMFAIQNH